MYQCGSAALWRQWGDGRRWCIHKSSKNAKGAKGAKGKKSKKAASKKNNKPKSKAKAKKKTKKKKKHSDLFEALEDDASPKVLADDLLSKFNRGTSENNHDDAVVVQLLNLIFRCSGMSSDVAPELVKQGDELINELNSGGSMIAKLQRESGNHSYPAAERNTRNRAFSKKLYEFWQRLVGACCSGTDPDCSTDGGLLERLVKQLAVIGHSVGAPFRHASVQSMTGIIAALGGKIQAVDDQLKSVNLKAAGELKKNKKTTKKASKVTLKNKQVLEDKRYNMLVLVDDLFSDVAAHR